MTNPAIDPRPTQPMAEGLGGRLILESAPGAGATARLELPHGPLAHAQASRGV